MSIDNELKLWQTIVVNVNEDMKLTIIFDYTKQFESSYSSIDQKNYYCYKYLGKMPKDKEQEELFKENSDRKKEFLDGIKVGNFQRNIIKILKEI